jgi:hypothetical protein
LAPSAPFDVKVGSFLFGASLATFALVMLWRHWMHVFLHEHGIREYRQRRGRCLRFEDVDEVTYSSLRLFSHGSYIHTIQKLALKSDGMSGPPLVCTHIFKEPNGRATGETRTPLINARDALSFQLAEMMSRRLSRGDAVEWVPRLRLRSRGLEVDDRGRVGFIEWRRVDKLDIDQGMFRLWLDADPKPILTAPAHIANFYPAYCLAMRLWQQAPG